MKWFDRWFAKKCKQAWEEEKDLTLESAGSVVSLTSSSTIDSRGMNFTVYRANGGHIIEHRVYDRKTDRHDNSLHIITDDKDLGEEIGRIITYENLRS